MFLKKSIKLLFDDEPPGFFVEAGALDGKYQSNTLYLENNHNWTGLLIEPEPDSFLQLSNRNRNAWTCNACLSTLEYPYQVNYFSCYNIIIR